MNYIFNELFFLQAVALVIVSLLFINTTPYALLILSLLLFCNFSLMLWYCGVTVFAIYFIFAEIHICYLIFCLTLSWVRFDTVHVSNLLSSNILISGRVFFVFLLIVGFTCLVNYSNNVFWFYVDNYIYNILLGRLLNISALMSGLNVNLLTALTQSYLTLHSFEFCLINFMMLLVTIIYFFIVAICRMNKRLYDAYRLFKILKFFKIKHTTIKTTKQVKQLTRCASSLYKQNRSLFVPRKTLKK